MANRRVLSIFGTRPEAIKMAPVVLALQAHPELESLVAVSGQHRDMLDQVLRLFEIDPDVDLAVMKAGQSLTHVTTKVLEGLVPVFEKLAPDMVLVHGDTTTSMAAALAAFYADIPVGHVEAGLRTGNVQSPWPEEMNRLLTGRLASMHFAPTAAAAENLRAENIADAQILTTGNTVIDALRWVLDNRLSPGEHLAACTSQFPFLEDQTHLVLVTGHRRESLDGGIERTCEALREIATSNDVQIVFPVHRNPLVIAAVEQVLGDIDNVFLTEPLDYVPFVWLMSRARVIVSDSGGVQEEAPALGVPVLVTRDTTERPEAIDAGGVRLVSTDRQRIVDETTRLLKDEKAHEQMAQSRSPYGDGLAAARIVEHIESSLHA